MVMMCVLMRMHCAVRMPMLVRMSVAGNMFVLVIVGMFVRMLDLRSLIADL